MVLFQAQTTIITICVLVDLSHEIKTNIQHTMLLVTVTELRNKDMSIKSTTNIRIIFISYNVFIHYYTTFSHHGARIIYYHTSANYFL